MPIECNNDTNAPTIEILEDEIYILQLSNSDNYADPGATCYDQEDGNISQNVEVSGDVVNLSNPEIYKINYNCQDSCSNQAAEMTRTVAVVVIPLETFGCTNQNASNYDPTASLDDGSCMLCDASQVSGSATSGCQWDCNSYHESCYTISDNGNGLCDFLYCDAINEGCTYQDATNYDSDANVDDGSCLFSGCTDPTAINFDEDANTNDASCVYSGCTNQNASNYDPTASLDDGSCMLCDASQVSGSATSGCQWDCNSYHESCYTISDNGNGLCDFLYCDAINEGCTYQDATNYDSDANVDDGSCLFSGCTDPTAINFDEDANTNDASCVYSGCTNQNASNYDPTASLDDGSCMLCDASQVSGSATSGCQWDCNSYHESCYTISDNGNGLCDFLYCDAINEGCTYQDATNYDSDANVDDGSCLFSGCTDPTAINFDEDANTNDASCVYSGCTNQNASNYDPTASLDDGSCMLCDASQVSGSATSGCQWDCNSYHESCYTISDNGNGLCDFLYCDAINEGCTYQDATNYDSDANVDDGSCLFSGCTDPTAINFDEDANTNDASCVYSGCTNQNASNYDPTASLDDGSCMLCDASQVSGSATSGCQWDCNSYHESCYTISDNGNGLCDFLYCDAINEGCTYQDATNYDSDANVDDGSCLFSGCTDPTAINFDEDANTNDASCVYSGCTNQNASNYDPTASLDDGSCMLCDASQVSGSATSGCQWDCNSYHESCYTISDNGNGLCDFLYCDAINEGCTYQDATNYDSDANVDDGSCLFSGCTDPTAINFDEDANTNDASCVYSGCTNQNASNYDPTASLDDGSCMLCDASQVSGSATSGCQWDCNSYHESCYTISDNGNGLCDFLYCDAINEGCTYQDATNYDSDANVDDGFCEFDIGDLNQDGEVDVLDIITLVNIILEKSSLNSNQTSENRTDINQDTNTNVLDVVSLTDAILDEDDIF